jgi:hypothetical protein
MKAKSLVLGLSLLVAALGLWFGRTAWRAHRQIVTLHVRNAPLADVLRQIERQTRTSIRAESNLNARITLNVTDKPLGSVLDRISEQAGAGWSAVRAVYSSRSSLHQLESALGGDGQLEAAGWTKIAPTLVGVRHQVGDAPPDLLGVIPGGGERRIITATEDIDIPAPRGTNAAAAGPAAGSRGTAPMVVRVIRRGGDGDGQPVEEEIWTPEELVLESTLQGKLGAGADERASADAAAAAAAKVGGKWTTYLAFRKSRFDFGFGGVEASMRGARRIQVNPHAGPPGATNLNAMVELGGPSPADLEAAMQRKRNDELGRLTPEQRVQRARERLSSPHP